MPHPYYPIYDYFTTQGADFLNKKVLDFGGNQGNLIKSSNGIIKQHDYTVFGCSAICIRYFLLVFV